MGKLVVRVVLVIGSAEDAVRPLRLVLPVSIFILADVPAPAQSRHIEYYIRPVGVAVAVGVLKGGLGGAWLGLSE